MVDPAKPDEPIRVNIDDREPVREFSSRPRTTPSSAASSTFGRYLWNSVFITVVATIITLLFNSMAAFALSKYEFTGRTGVFLLIIGTLMMPPAIVLVPIFLVVSELGPAQQPVGRDLARGGHAHRRVPAAPVHADDPRRTARRGAHGPRERVAHLLADRAAAGRAGAGGAGDLLGDVALERFPVAADRAVASEQFTLQLALNAFQGELVTQWHYLLAMTVMTLLPITLVFAFLQKYITAGIASAE